MFLSKMINLHLPKEYLIEKTLRAKCAKLPVVAEKFLLGDARTSVNSEDAQTINKSVI